MNRTADLVVRRSAFPGRRRGVGLLAWKEWRAFAHLPPRGVQPRQTVESLVGDAARRAELTPELLRFAWHERMQQNALAGESANHRREHVVELRVSGLVLRQRPRLRGLNELIAARHA